MFLRFFTLLLLLSHAQIIQASFSKKDLRELAEECHAEEMQAHAKTQASFQTNKSNLLASNSLKQQNYQNIAQDELIQQITGQVKNAAEQLTALNSTTETGLSEIGILSKKYQEQQAEAIKILTETNHNLERRVAALETRQDECCLIS